MQYILQERERQRTDYHCVYDIIVDNKFSGWLDCVKDYTPHVRITDKHHKLNKKAMVKAIAETGDLGDGSFFVLSDLIFPEPVEVTV